jgi:hypothetical protein
MKISDYIKSNLSGSIKVGFDSTLYVDDISAIAREYLVNNCATLGNNNHGQILIGLPKDTVIVPVNPHSGPETATISLALYILPDGSILEAVTLLAVHGGNGKVLLGAP